MEVMFVTRHPWVLGKRASGKSIFAIFSNKPSGRLYKTEIARFKRISHREPLWRGQPAAQPLLACFLASAKEKNDPPPSAPGTKLPITDDNYGRWQFGFSCLPCANRYQGTLCRIFGSFGS